MKSEAQWEELGGCGKGWVDHPDKAANPYKDEPPSIPETSNEVGKIEPGSDELEAKTEDELKEMLMSQGVPKKKLKGMSKAQLIEMIEG